jgi:predicted phage-related endonuclease
VPNAVIQMLAFALSAGMASAADAAAAAEDELLERIAAFRAAVADSLHETSKDYQILHNLSQSDLTSCDEVTAELRRRLDGNIHYSVLGKLDEMHALVAAHVDRKE